MGPDNAIILIKMIIIPQRNTILSIYSQTKHGCQTLYAVIHYRETIFIQTGLYSPLPLLDWPKTALGWPISRTVTIMHISLIDCSAIILLFYKYCASSCLVFCTPYIIDTKNSDCHSLWFFEFHRSRNWQHKFAAARGQNMPKKISTQPSCDGKCLIMQMDSSSRSSQGLSHRLLLAECYSYFE